ncbi:MAG: orotate phosphoribosyltransferase [Candidatus Thermoplasmatota archaeon]|nr:orotate phosphoribosyltransferase [Candidatus Thermoplasmatota archaeon]MBU1941239.1 orotate phosphoribosyltransferase [Candidatus Thermoplasmatota archaeon]
MNKKELITQLKACNAIQFGKFILTSGAVSDYYIDIKKASTHPTTLKIIAETMAPLTKGYDVLAGMELGAVPLVVALALETNIPFVIIRKEKREHGTGKQIEGHDIKNKKVLLIEDVTTSGGSVLKSIQILKDHTAQIDQVLTVVDRESGARKKIESLNITFTPLITISDILKK